MAHSTFNIGDLTAIIGDNTAHEKHRTGYNGVWSLTHRAHGGRNIFVPEVAGLNFEHIFNGEEPADSKVFLEPRNAPMTFRRLGESESELHQPPTPTFHVESWTHFKLVAPHYLDMHFRCVAHRHVFPHDYLGLFWASYINAPPDKSMYFLGGLTDEEDSLWMQHCTQFHNHDSTVRHRGDSLDLAFAPGRDTLFKNLAAFRFNEPFFYGNCDELVWIVMFDRAEGIRLTHSPSGGGADAALQTTHPAWDFQFLVPRPRIMCEYGFHVRTVLRPRCSRDEIQREYQQWKGGFKP